MRRWDKDDIISAIVDFFPMVSQHCNTDDVDFIEKQTPFGHIPWEHFVQFMNPSADSRIYNLTVCKKKTILTLN